MNEERPLAENDLIQVNEDGPPDWFRCILVVDDVLSWGVQAYCSLPGIRGGHSNDVYIRLHFGEFDRLGVKSKFVAVAMPESL
jgi:hypothetical protein